ncbi:phosphate/phosphite/phosphonate ABC transporter substrate-binding protein [Paenibacillus naphthalenovorans]|uniref:phosphate/phosphite/phosphonate ABC transporter substrate-binding protein n=1 Tax=Paenibacillus naphthalenovorans TaxID=162209 RepID=UPI00088586D8|nr:phosphate/phosphite/phosphonate ABC transporter substrate-binding protein [Paenibacillus naphthalenovorans]SDJ02441.1 phosphonate transport system substrate-binding protein [Paenibacillus naphthalenovorans]
MFHKFASISLSLVLLAGIAAGCGPQQDNAPTDRGDQQETPAARYVPKELKVQVVPPHNAETLEAKAKPLEKLLGNKLNIPVKISASTNDHTVIEALSSRQADIGFLPPNAYVLAHDQKKAADVLLQAQRYGIEDATGAETNELVDVYKAMIIVKADSPIHALKDLKGKKIAWQDAASSAGYVWPANEMKKAGVDPKKDVTGIEVKGHDKGVLAVLNGQVDAAAIYQDARNLVIKDRPDVFRQTRVVAFTAPIPTDTISVRNDMDQAWRDKIAQAFIDIGKDPEGSKIIYDVFSHRGYVKSDDRKFNIVRDYFKNAGQK